MRLIDRYPRTEGSEHLAKNMDGVGGNRLLIDNIHIRQRHQASAHGLDLRIRMTRDRSYQNQ